MTEIQGLIKKRGIIKASLSRFGAFINRLENEEVTISELKVRLKKVEELWFNFMEIQTKIDSLSEDMAHQEEEREQFETKYFELTGRAEHFLEIDATQSSNTDKGYSFGAIKNQQTVVKLPPLPNLVSFSGRYEDWMSFHDTFKAVIIEHPSLSDVQKFQYLKSALTGDAFKEIATLSLTSANFPVAWKLLIDRYQNKRIIVEKHIQGLFNLPTVEEESSSALRSLIDTTQMHLRALEALSQPVTYWDSLIVYMVTCNLDKISFKEWESTVKDEEPTLEDLIKFINRRCKTLESLESRNAQRKEASVIKDRLNSCKCKCNISKSKHINTFVSQEETCVVCGERHHLFACNNFRSASVKQRYEFAKKAGVCFNCLKCKHRAETCGSGKCRVCGKKHNTLLHYEAITKIVDTNQKPSEPSISVAQTSSQEVKLSPSTDVHVGHSASTNSREVLLPTVLVDICDNNGHTATCRALLDNGSQSSFITQELCARLGLTKTKIELSVRGINQLQSTITHSTTATVYSRHSNFHTSMKCLVVSDISGNLPAHEINITNLNIPNNVVLSDPKFHEPASVDLLIGSDLFWDILGTRKIKLAEEGPYLRDSLLGWIVVGSVTHNYYSASPNTQVMFNLLDRQIDKSNLDQKLKGLWKLGETESVMQPKKERNGLYSIGTHKKSSDSLFTMRLPIKKNTDQLGNQ